MNRQKLVEVLCSIANGSSESLVTPEEATSLLNDLVESRRSVSEVLTILDSKSKYWSQVKLPESLRSNLKRYTKGELNDIQQLKLVSSIITRSLIECEHHSDLELDNLGALEFLQYLYDELVNEDSDIDLEELLKKYGLIKDKEVE